MAAISNYLENALINHTLRNTALPSPTAVYVGLFLSDPTDANTGTQVTGTAYARQPVTFSAPSNGATSNTADIEFPVAGSDWGTITHLGIFDAATGGNLLYHGAFTVSKIIQNGDQFIIRAGDLDISLQ